VTEDLRALMRSELSEERPPPLGDLIVTAMRDGRRITRRRRFVVAGASAAVLAVVAGGAVAGWQAGGAGPQPALPAANGTTSEPTGTAKAPTPAKAEPTQTEAPTASATTQTASPETGPDVRTVRLRGTHTTGEQAAATPQAVLELLTQLLPEGKVSKLAADDNDGLFAQVYLDTGKGPGMLRVWLKPYQSKTLQPGTAKIEIDGLPDNCVQSTIVNASYSTGGHLEMNIATCLGSDSKPAAQPLTVDQAVDIMSDARWGTRMDARLVTLGAKRFADVPAEAR
jgi:hypothetical protein